jgi:hypothetical protein
MASKEFHVEINRNLLIVLAVVLGLALLVGAIAFGKRVISDYRYHNMVEKCTKQVDAAKTIYDITPDCFNFIIEHRNR